MYTHFPTALPTLRASCDPEAKAGEYYGPGGFTGTMGAPALLEASELSHNEELAKWYGCLNDADL